MTSGLRQESRTRFSTWRNLLLGVAVLGLIVGLATRYCDLGPSVSTTAAVSSGANAKHQHLDRDAFEWTPQVSDFSIFVLFVCARHAPPAAEPLLVAHLDDSLYNRPPPASV